MTARCRRAEGLASLTVIWGVAAVVALLAPFGAVADGPAAPSDQRPKPTTLTESIEKRLMQLDVAVEGDPDAIRAITAKDFVFYVGTQEVTGLIVDPLCGESSSPESQSQPTPTVESSEPNARPKPTRPRGTFVFFFDQPHLTQAGREMSLERARELIGRLVVDGSRASIVSSARSLQTIVPLTGDRDKLLDGLVRLRADLRQWDSYAVTESARAADIASVKSAHMQCMIAMNYATEEFLMARQTLARIGYTVGSLAEVPAPKALVYFGDSLRQKAGLHYLGIPFDCPPGAAKNLVPSALEAAELVPSAAFEFDAAINEALARGVHFFTIQAEGFNLYRRGWDTERHRHAQDTLVGLAAETGGEAFLGGASNKYITDRISAASSCRLLLSFPPGDLPRDTPLAVTLELHVPKVKIRAQGRIVVPSQASIENARLMAAFLDPVSYDDGSLRALLIPRGGDGKVWKSAVQLRLRPSGLPDNRIELGATIVRGDKAIGQFASSMATKRGTRPLVVENVVDIPPGEFSVVAVARDTNRGDIVSTRLAADWPNPAKSPAAIAPVAVLQSGPAAMSKDGAVSSSGLLARDIDEPLDPSASITLETVVCRGARTNAPVIVERSIADELPNEFTPMTIPVSELPCVQVIDVVKAGRLRQPVVDYRVTARIGDEIVAQERRALRVAVPTDPR